MTSFDDLMRQYGSFADEADEQAKKPQDQVTKDPQFGGVRSPINQAAGIKEDNTPGPVGQAFNTAIKVASTTGQMSMGVMKYIQQSQQYGSEITLDGMLAAGEQAKDRLWASKNLGELGANVISGAELWKNAPGPVGEFFRRDTAVSKSMLFVMGLGTEIVADPTTYLTAGIGAVAKAAGTRVAVQAAKGTITAADAANRTTQIGKNAKLTNQVATAVVTGGLSLGLQGAGYGLRTAVGMTVNKLRQHALSDSPNVGAKALSANLLNWLDTRTASASDGVRQSLASFQALSNNGGRYLLQAADRVDKITNLLPEASRLGAQRDMQMYFTHLTKDPAVAQKAYDNLIAAGVNPRDLANAASSNAKGQKYLFNMMAEAGENVTQMQDHMMQSYMMFYGNPKVQGEFLRYLTETATPPSFWLNEGELGDQLRQNLKKLTVAAPAAQPSPLGARVKPKPQSIDADEFMQDLSKFWEGRIKLAPPAFNELNDVSAPEYAKILNLPGAKTADEVREQAMKVTMDDLIDFVDVYGQAKGWSTTTIQSVAKRTADAVLHVPGDAEFAASFVMGGTQFGRGLDDYGRQLLNKQGISVAGAQAGVYDSRALVEPYQKLLGRIEEAGPGLEYQARTQVKAIARTKLFKEMVEQGAVVFEKDMTSNLQPLTSKGWMAIPDDASYGIARGGFVRVGDWAAVQAAEKNFDSGKIMGFASKVSGVLKRAQLIYDVSAWSAQFLGNIAFLDAAGYKPLGFLGVDAGVQWKRAAADLARQDGRYEQMIQAGVDVSMHNLDEATSKRLQADVLMHSIQDKSSHAPQVLESLLTRVNSTFTELSNTVRRPVDAAVLAVERQSLPTPTASTGPGALYDEATINASNQRGSTLRNVTSASAMFGYSDQITRVFAFNRGLDRAEMIMKKANPVTRGIFDNGVPDFSKLKGQIADQEIDRLQRVWQTQLKDTAEMANDVALNYHDAPLLAQGAAQSGIIPFAKFAWLSTGRTVEWMVENPAILARYHRIARNAGDAFWHGTEEDREAHIQGLPEPYRQSLNFPLPMSDELGRPKVWNATRWLPFSSLQNAAYEGADSQARGPEPLLTNLAGMPLLDFAVGGLAIVGGQDQRISAFGTELASGRPAEPDQGIFAALAAHTARTFLPASFAPGGRTMSLLAKAIEHSTYSVDPQTGLPANPQIGSFPEGITNPVAKALHTYGSAPAIAGNLIDQATGMGGSATGQIQPQPQQRPNHTLGSTLQKGLVPGMGIASDPGKARAQAVKTIDARIDKLQADRTELESRFKYAPMSTAAEQRLTQIINDQRRLQSQKTRLIGQFNGVNSVVDPTTLGK